MASLKGDYSPSRVYSHGTDYGPSLVSARDPGVLRFSLVVVIFLKVSGSDVVKGCSDGSSLTVLPKEKEKRQEKKRKETRKEGQYGEVKLAAVSCAHLQDKQMQFRRPDR